MERAAHAWRIWCELLKVLLLWAAEQGGERSVASSLLNSIPDRGYISEDFKSREPGLLLLLLLLKTHHPGQCF